MPPDKLSVVVFSGTFDKVHYALALAAAAAAVGTPATLFFTMGACRALAAPGADGVPGWRSLPAGDAAGDSGGAVDDGYRDRGVGTFEDLLSACVELGVTLMVCEMGLRAIGLDRAELRADLPLAEGGIVTFLNDASATGAVLFV